MYTEIKGAVEELQFHNRRIYKKLQGLSQKEYLWPFSNPPYIENEKDIPVAVFEGGQVSKTAYRDYLSEKYGRYKMTFSGIHVNFSFSEELLKQNIELRMFDLNPLAEAGVEEKDILFAQLLMVWLAASPDRPFTQKDQIQAVQNFKNAARYDLKTVRIQDLDGENTSVAKAAAKVIGEMKEFYQKLGFPVQDVLEFEYEKFTDAKNRYAWKIRERFWDGYVKKALKLAKERQER